MTDLEDMDELEADDGPPAPYAEHRLGERVFYQRQGQQCTGTIVSVAAPQFVAATQIPITSVMVRDHHEGIPDEVLPGEILQAAECPTSQRRMNIGAVYVPGSAQKL